MQAKLRASVVIPAFNRIAPLRYTLKSVRRALRDISGEVILVDDGSEPSLAEQLVDDLYPEVTIIRQHNQGSIFARLAGLERASAEYVLFLDSDDLLYPDKLIAHVTAMEEAKADMSYCDSGHVLLEGEYENLVYRDQACYPLEDSSVEMLLRIQPPPHCLMYRRSYLEDSLEAPFVAPNRVFDSVGDVWLAYNLAPFSTKIVKVDSQLSATGEHSDERYTQHWEKLGIDALLLSLAFKNSCETRQVSDEVKQIVGECAFISWRKLPRHFHDEFEAQMLQIWRELSTDRPNKLGGRGFQILAQIVGSVRAGAILRRFLRPEYSAIATYSRGELNKLISSKLEALRGL